MSGLGIIIAISTLIGLVALCHCFYYFDRSRLYQRKADKCQTIVSLAYRDTAGTYIRVGNRLAVIGVILILIGGTYFRLGGM